LTDNRNIQNGFIGFGDKVSMIDSIQLVPLMSFVVATRYSAGAGINTGGTYRTLIKIHH